jgi:metal-sulfur cluster biosynthetic enzyme
MKITKKTVLEKLEQVMDPEIHISIVDLGLIYGVVLKKDTVKIVMTLTTIGCPLFSLIEQDVRAKIRELGFSEDKIDLELTFDPPWTMDRLSEKGKAMMGI